MFWLRRPRSVRTAGSGFRVSGSVARSVLVGTPAKLNLFLEARSKREDGFHEIASLLVTIDLFDTLRICPNQQGTLRLRCNRPELEGNENLVLKAAKALRERSGTTLGADMNLTKRIPSEAGLGGGSSDAGAALAGLNEAWDLGMPREELNEMAGSLGSDVPFFLGSPAAWCTGRGERVEPQRTPREALNFVVVKPSFGVPTAQAYGRVKVSDRPENGAELRDAFAAGNTERIGRGLFNRLLGPAEEIRPGIAKIRGRLESMGTAGVGMSGSGSTLFALCRDRREALRVAQEVRADTSPELRGCRVFASRGPVRPAVGVFEGSPRQ